MSSGFKFLLLLTGAVSVGGIFYLAWSKRKDGPESDEDGGEKPPQINPGKGSTVTEPNWTSPFDQTYIADLEAFVHPKQIRKPARSRVDKWVTRIWDAKGNTWFSDDDEDEVLQVFSEMHDAVEVAALSAAFYTQKNRDLWKFLASFLSEDELNTYVETPVLRLSAYHLTT